MVDRARRINGETLIGRIGNPEEVTIDADNTSYQMKPEQTCMRFITALADASAIVILPSLGEAVGNFYYICAPTGAAGGDISVYEKETGAELSTYGDMDADDDHMILFSDGTIWRVVLDGVA